MADKKRAKKPTTQTVNFVRALCISESILRCVATFLTTSTIPDMLAMCYLLNCSLRRRHDSPPNSAPGTVDRFVQKENGCLASTATDSRAGGSLSGKASSTRQPRSLCQPTAVLQLRDRDARLYNVVHLMHHFLLQAACNTLNVDGKQNQDALPLKVRGNLNCARQYPNTALEHQRDHYPCRT